MTRFSEILHNSVLPPHPVFRGHLDPLATARGLCETFLMASQSILITGCSRGIGLALAKQMAAHGWQVLAGARHPAAAHALQAAAREATPGSIDILSLDVRSDESVKAAAEEAAVKVRGLDVLVNNAGVFPEEGNEPLEQLPLECFDRIGLYVLSS